MPDQTPIYGLRFQELNDPPDGPSLGEDLALDVEDELQRIDSNVSSNDSDISSLQSRVTTNENDIADLKKGWNFIDSGRESTDFSIDLTAGGAYPAGTFRMIKIHLDDLRLDAGNSWIVFRLNSLAGATDYSRGWHGESFDGTTTTRNSSNSSDRGVAGYVSAQRGNVLDIVLYRTHELSDVPVKGESRRGAPDGFDGNREWMLTTNVLNTDILVDTIDFFATSTPVIAEANWYAEGFRV